jgi:hypothetical protein
MWFDLIKIEGLDVVSCQAKHAIFVAIIVHALGGTAIASNAHVLII